MKTTSDAIEIINRMTSDDPELQAMVRESFLNAQVAEIVYSSRENAGLTQEQLANLVGISEAEIAQLEDADYHGDALSILARIAVVLDRRLEIKMIPRNVALA